MDPIRSANDGYLSVNIAAADSIAEQDQIQLLVAVMAQELAQTIDSLVVGNGDTSNGVLPAEQLGNFDPSEKSDEMNFDITNPAYIALLSPY